MVCSSEWHELQVGVAFTPACVTRTCVNVERSRSPLVPSGRSCWGKSFLRSMHGLCLRECSLECTGQSMSKQKFQWIGVEDQCSALLPVLHLFSYTSMPGVSGLFQPEQHYQMSRKGVTQVISNIQHYTHSLPARMQMFPSDAVSLIQKKRIIAVREGILHLSSQSTSWDFSRRTQRMLHLLLKGPFKIMVSSCAKDSNFLAEYLKMNTSAQSWKFLSF